MRKSADNQYKQNLELPDRFLCPLLVCLWDDTRQMADRSRQIIQPRPILHDWRVWDQWNPLWKSMLLCVTTNFAQLRRQAMLCVRFFLTWSKQRKFSPPGKKIQKIAGFWDMTPCILVYCYWLSEEPSYFWYILFTNVACPSVTSVKTHQTRRCHNLHYCSNQTRYTNLSSLTIYTVRIKWVTSGKPVMVEHRWLCACHRLTQTPVCRGFWLQTHRHTSVANSM